MTAFQKIFRRVSLRKRGAEQPPGTPAVATARMPPGTPAPATAEASEVPPVDIAPNDPIIPYFQAASGAVDLDSLDLESPAKDALKYAGMKLVVPLVSQGELIGLLNLGPRLSERDYSADDRKLLDNLAAHAAPAVRVAQLVRQQEAEIRARERIEQELHVAQLIQQQFLPKELPELPGWQVTAYYQPARQVGGDFYDFIELPDGLIGIVVGDVTDKGVPAALVMATTHSILRSDAPRLLSPGEVLQRANDLLFPDIPAHMFVTCLYAVLDPATGHLRYANAGHNLPYVRSADGVHELRAIGMPLGLMPGMTYEEKETTVGSAETVLLHSDGVAEAHNPSGEMFGFPRLQALVAEGAEDSLIDSLLSELDSFTLPGWEQEDDITLVAIRRTGGRAASEGSAAPVEKVPTASRNGKTLADFTVRSEAGNERLVMERVVHAVEGLQLPSARLEKLKTAVAEATMNAIEHGNKNRAELPVAVRVLTSDDALSVWITDEGGSQEIPQAETPDLEAKLTGEQSPRGWGLFLIKNMVDDMNVHSDEKHHTIELVLHLKGQQDATDAI
jgi:serine phosphatase RsbU (regulator of sigma subunit)/anti-sigma regulatory factor (Ser/Thr protein kinase)